MAQLQHSCYHCLCNIISCKHIFRLIIGQNSIDIANATFYCVRSVDRPFCYCYQPIQAVVCFVLWGECSSHSRLVVSEMGFPWRQLWIQIHILRLALSLSVNGEKNTKRHHEVNEVPYQDTHDIAHMYKHDVCIARMTFYTILIVLGFIWSYLQSHNAECGERESVHETKRNHTLKMNDSDSHKEKHIVLYMRVE